MNRRPEKTKDGSSTLFVPELNQHYHSIHGALQESQHVFLAAGYAALNRSPIHILEVGLGTGLNALLTADAARQSQRDTYYTAIEKYPLRAEEVQSLNYSEHLPGNQALLNEIHACNWEEWVPLHAHFSLRKWQLDLRELQLDPQFDLIYFDAFAPDAQPSLWTEEIFRKMYGALKPGGMLTTYCVKGAIRRNMQAAGFRVEKIPGPPGKREMARAWKETYITSAP